MVNINGGQQPYPIPPAATPVPPARLPAQAPAAAASPDAPHTTPQQKLEKFLDKNTAQLITDAATEPNTLNFSRPQHKPKGFLAFLQQALSQLSGSLSGEQKQALGGIVKEVNAAKGQLTPEQTEHLLQRVDQVLPENPEVSASIRQSLEPSTEAAPLFPEKPFFELPRQLTDQGDDPTMLVRYASVFSLR